MTISLRPATPNDVDGVADVWHRAWADGHAGNVPDELYQYRATHPDVRGRRIPEVWVWPLARRNEQVAHWSRALRAYSFKIPLDPGRTPLVLEATFDLGMDRGRLSNQIVLEPAEPTPPLTPPTTAPATAPALLGG